MIPSFALTTSHSLDLEVPFFRSCDCAIHLSVPSVKDIQVSQYEAYSSHHLRCLRWSCGGPELVRPTTMRCKCLKPRHPPRTLLPHHDCVLMGILLLRTLCRVCLAAGIKLKYPQQACVGNFFGDAVHWTSNVSARIKTSLVDFRAALSPNAPQLISRVTAARPLGVQKAEDSQRPFNSPASFVQRECLNVPARISACAMFTLTPCTTAKASKSHNPLPAQPRPVLQLLGPAQPVAWLPAPCPPLAPRPHRPSPLLRQCPVLTHLVCVHIFFIMTVNDPIPVALSTSPNFV
jgi:hypothetical protein